MEGSGPDAVAFVGKLRRFRRQRPKNGVQNGRQRRMPRLSVVAAGVAVVLSIGAVALEALSVDVRTWYAAHPVTASLTAGVLVLSLTVFLVERAVTSLESRRWEKPARAAVDTFIFSADRTDRLIGEEIAKARGDDESASSRAAALTDVAMRDHSRVISLSQAVRRHIDQLAPVVLTLAQTVARHEPSKDNLEEMFRHHIGLAQLADDIYATGMKALVLRGHVARRERVEEAAAKVDAELAGLHDIVEDMRLRYLELNDG